VGKFWFDHFFSTWKYLSQFTPAASLVALLVVDAYKNSIIADRFDNPIHVDYCWRILIGLGCVPGAIALYFRLTIPETPRFTIDIDRDVQRARTDIHNVLNKRAKLGVYWINPDAVVQHVQIRHPSRRDFMQYFGDWDNLRLLLAAAYSWFAIDVSSLFD
jgi:MFS transporter, PHS family, inorganic phosphate transporter